MCFLFEMPDFLGSKYLKWLIFPIFTEIFWKSNMKIGTLQMFWILKSGIFQIKITRLVFKQQREFFLTVTLRKSSLPTIREVFAKVTRDRVITNHEVIVHTQNPRKMNSNCNFQFSLPVEAVLKIWLPSAGLSGYRHVQN